MTISKGDCEAEHIRMLKFYVNLSCCFFSTAATPPTIFSCVFSDYSPIGGEVRGTIMVARCPHNLRSDPPDQPSTHSAPCVVTTTLLTIFPTLQHSASLWPFCNNQIVLLNPFAFFTQPSTPLSSGRCFFLKGKHYS